MKVESSIKETTINTTTAPVKDTNEIIEIICKWNEITKNRFSEIVWPYSFIGNDTDNNPIYARNGVIINPIGVYLKNVYDWKDIVFEKWKDKYFWRLQVRSASWMRYQLGDSIIEIPFGIKAVNEDTGEGITIFPKTSDILQSRMKGLYVVNTGWAERQRIEKEIMAKFIELAMVKGWNEIISTQNMVEDLQQALKKRWIDFKLENEFIFLNIPWRKVRDTAGEDSEYMAPPIEIRIDFNNRSIGCKGYSSHGFWTPTSYWNPCWWNRDNDVHKCLRECSIKELINLMISRAYGYNSNDTGREHDCRHPLAKLRDYIWWVYNNREETSDEWKAIRQWITDNYADIFKDLEIDTWLEGSDTRDFISSLKANNETSEQW